MADLKHTYNQLFEVSFPKITSGEISIDRKIEHDDRFGLTVVIRPDLHTKKHISAFLDELRAIDPKQYYYPCSDMHVTVLSIVSGNSGFELADVDVSKYARIISDSLQNIGVFNIELKGVTTSAEAVLIQGFPSDETLEKLRDNLRTNFKKSGLHHTIDVRYAISTAHVTAVRFASELKNPVEFAHVISKYREHCFGAFAVQKLEFVCNDWYQKESKTVLLRDFLLMR